MPRQLLQQDIAEILLAFPNAFANSSGLYVKSALDSPFSFELNAKSIRLGLSLEATIRPTDKSHWMRDTPPTVPRKNGVEYASFIQYRIAPHILTTIGYILQEQIVKHRPAKFSQFYNEQANLDLRESPYQPMNPWEYIPNLEPYDFSSKARLYLSYRRLNEERLTHIFSTILQDQTLTQAGLYNFGEGKLTFPVREPKSQTSPQKSKTTTEQSQQEV